MTHGSVFTGIGGFDLAAQWMEWNNVFHCEINPFGRKVLKYYWPNSISYDDIKTTDFSIHAGTIDVFTGGFPCQPYSLAGKRKGKEDDRHLWPWMLAAIKAIQPRWVVGENVHGIINWSNGLVFNQVQADLETAGYEVFAYVLPACGLGAPHRRERTWFIAHANSIGHGRIQQELGSKCKDSIRLGGTSKTEIASDPSGQRLSIDAQAQQCGPLKTNQKSKGSATNGGITAGEQWLSFPTQSPICVRNDGFPAELDGIAFPEWRRESIKAAGNAVVPQLVYEIFKTIELYEQKEHTNY